MDRTTSPLREARGSAVALSSEGVRERARILLVDDDKRNLLALSEVLEDLADVVCAVSGEEALRFLLRERFAVVILDVLMPGLDGYDTARLLRGREQSRDTPVIFLSAINKEEQHLLRGYDIGAVDYVFKPFEPLILRSKVSVFVSLHDKTREIERKAQVEQRLMREKLAAQEGRVQALRALEESENRQSMILQSLPLAVYVRDDPSLLATPRFIAGNAAAITGFEADAFEDASVWPSRVHPDDLAEPDDADGVVSREFRWRHADGGYRYLLDQCVQLADGDGRYAGTLRDVTAQHQLQNQLLQAQKMDAIGKLTGGIAHDFNNLLASVLSGLSLIERRSELNPKASEILGMTRHAAEQGKQLVSRMLAFSRRQSLTPRPVDLSELGRTLNALLAPVLGGLVHLQWDIGADVGCVLADAPQLELALMNLVINARDAMPAGGTVIIRARNNGDTIPTDLTQGSYVVMTVSDTGRGIPPEYVAKVIEPFFTTKDIGKGTGLGLSTAYGFVKQSGGTLRIDSTVGSGTTVEIWLPRSAEPAEDARPEIHPLKLEVDRESSAAARVLLVDDNASLRALTEMQLSEEGYDVVSAAGGAEALALIERDARRFDVIVTDFAMPLISGLEVIRLARNVRSGWPAVIITGHADAGSIADRPVDVPLLSKPFTTDDLVGAISLSLRNAPGAVASEVR
jgi:signal transduction histidine kinase/two-component SAPR family response regulator